mgnify:CR=1 FL=1
MPETRNSYKYKDTFGFFITQLGFLPGNRLKVLMVLLQPLIICIFSGVKRFVPFCALLLGSISNAPGLKALAVYIFKEVCGVIIPNDVQKELNLCDVDLILTVAALISPFKTFDIIMAFIQTRRPDFTNLTYFGQRVSNLISSLFNCYADDLSYQDQMILNWIDSYLSDQFTLDHEQENIDTNAYDLFNNPEFEGWDNFLPE